MWKVADSHRGRRFHTELIDGVKVHRTPTYIPSADKATAPRRIVMESSFTLNSTLWWLRYLAARERPDVVIAVCPPTQTIMWPSVMRKLHQIPILFHVQDLQLDAASQLGMLGSERMMWLLERLERSALRAATHVTTISAKMRQAIISKGVDAGRVSLLPNWSSISAETDGARIAKARRRLGARDGQLLVLYSGNLGRKQGLDVLIDAARLLKHRSDIHWVIIGGGADEARLRAKASEAGLPPNLFRELVPESELPSTLAAADVHLVIQKSEAADLVMPSKLTNILAAGRPTIATAHRDTEVGEVIAGRETGLLTRPGDAAALATAIVRVSNERDLLAMMGGNAAAFAAEHLRMDVVLGRLETLLAGLALERG